MPIYRSKNKTYNVPENLVGEFEKDNPHATIAYEAEGDVYDIPVYKKSAFLKQFPKASLYDEKTIAYEVDGDVYDIPMYKKDAFLKQFPKASLYNEGTTSPAESSLSPEASAMIDELKAKIRDVKPVQRESSLQELVDRQREADKQSSRRLPQLRQEVARPDAIRQEQIILPVEHSDRNDEERDIDSRFKPREAASPEDIYSNYIDRFALTRRGQELQSELVDIQRGVNDRYAGEFLQSDEYRALADRYTGQELNNKANEDFNRIYGERINKDMQPYIMAYQNEVLKRYGDRINEDMKQLTKEQVAGDIDKLSASVGKQLGDAHSRLSQQGGTGGNVMNVLMGSRRYNTDKAINAERRQLGELEVAQNLLNDSKEIIAEAQKRGNTNFMAGLGRGLYDTVFDADTWSMGLTDLREGKLLMDVLDKFDRGERLNDSEQALMDAAVANLATNAYYYSDLGRGYKAGMTTGQSIPFMLEFAINPVSGSGSAIAKSILRYGMKKFGAKTAKRGVSRMAARLAGDALAATGLTGTTGSARVAAGTMERMTGDIQLDNTGRHYAGRTGQQSAGEALGKSFASSFLENQSEMVFNAFKGFGPVVWAQAERVLPGGVGSLMDDALTGKTWNFYRKLKSSPVLVEAAKRTQFHGLFGEYAEELYNNFANIPLGEMTLEEATDLDNNIDTFLGLAPTSVAFSLLGLGGLAHERYRYRRQKQRMLGQMTEEEREKMTKLEELSKERGNEDIKRFIKETITATNLTPEEKKQEIAYAYNIAVNNALDDVDKARKQEVRNNHDASFREGQAIYEEHDPTQMRQTVLRREVALERLTGMGIDEQSIQELSEIPVEEREEKLSTYTDDVRDATLDYLNALDREAGMNDAMDTAHAGEVEHARNLLGEITASGGNVTLVPLGKYGSKDAQWGVVVKGLDANGMPTQSNGALMVYPIQMDNNVPVFSSINEDSPLTVIPESMTDAMIVSPDDALRGMLSSYQQDADIQEGTPIAPQSSFPILDEAGAVQTVTVLGNDGAGNWILQMPDGSVSSPIADDVLRKRKRDAEVAPILQEYAAASQVQEEARKEVDKEESVAQQREETASQSASIPKPRPGDRFTVDGKTAVVKEIAPDGIIVDYVNEEGDITGADQLTFSTYSEALSRNPQSEYEHYIETGAVSDAVVDRIAMKIAHGEPLTNEEESMRRGAAQHVEDVLRKLTHLTKEEADNLISQMEERAEVAPEIELTIENWDAEFGKDGIVGTPIGEVKMGENQFAKLMRKGRNGKLGMIKPTLENPDIIIEDKSEAKNGKTAERETSYVFVKAFIKNEGSRYYYFTSITVSQDGKEVVVSNQEKSRNRVLRLMLEGSVIWRTPKDATTSSAEKQGLDYAHPNEAEDAAKGSGITPQSTSSVSEDTDKSEIVQARSPKTSLIPKGKDGRLLYYKAPVEATLDDLLDGQLSSDEVDAFIEENAKAALQLLKKTSEKPPKIGTDKAKYLADKQAWQARVDDALAQVDYWQQVADELAARRERPGDRTAAEILAMGEPMDGEELAAQMLANGSLPLLRESYLRETGAGNEEARGMLGLFASKEKGGLTIEQAGEKLMLADSENGTHFFDPNDANAGRDALISVLSAAKTRGDLTNFIRNRRAEQARREQEAEREAYDSWCEANFHMSAEEYEAYENEFLPLVGESLLTEEQYVEFISIFGEELNRRNNETRRIDTENTSNEPGRAAGIPERSGTVLSEEETVPSGRAGTTETRPATAGTRVGTADGAVQGSASGRETGQGQTEGGNDSQLEGNSASKSEEYTLSSERSGNGEPFYQDANGNIDLVDIPQDVFDEIGYSKAPFRLTPGMILHVLNGHGKELGVSTIEETVHFVLDVMKHFDHVRLGYDGALIFSIENGRKRIGKRAVTVLINSDNGKFYGLKTSGYETVNGLSKRPLLWERGANEVSSTTDAASASVPTGKSSLSGEQSGSASHQSKSLSKKYDALQTAASKPHGDTPSSVRKDTDKLTVTQTIGEKVAKTEEETEQRETELASRVEVSDDDWQEGDNESLTYKRSITIDGKHTATQVDQPDKDGHYTSSYFEFNNKRFGDLQELVDYIDNGNTLASKIAQAEAETDTNPTDGQKEAGNYKKGHVRIGQFDITVENPKGSVRRGTDANGNPWQTTMHNTYGYIRGTEGVDGDHIDVFLTDDIDGWNGRRVYVVDQYNEDGTFDEHKVMLGFNDEADARDAYFSNYSKGWADNRKIVMTSTNLEDFEKWIDSSHRKTKPFAEYRSIETPHFDNQGNPVNADGSLLAEKIETIEGLADEDFFHPKRNVQLPALPEKVDAAIGADGKPVVIKKNIFEKNRKSHKDLSPTQSREILSNALYHTDLYGQNQKAKRPYNWILIHNAAKHSAVILEVSHKKDNVEIVNWHYLNDGTLAQKERQAIEEGGLILTLESAAGNTLNDLSSGNKGTTSAADKQAKPNKRDNIQYSIEPTQYTTKRGKVLDMFFVKFVEPLTKEQQRAAKDLAKAEKGWYDHEKGGFMMRSEERAQKLADTVLERTGNSENPLTLKPWAEMDAGERMSEAEKSPLTREEIANAPTDEVNKANAMDYLNGNYGLIQSISYLKVYEDVRNSTGSVAAAGGTADKAQLDETDTGSQQELGRGAGRPRGVASVPLGGGTGEKTLSGSGGHVHDSTYSEERPAAGIGEGGRVDVSGEEQRVDGRAVRGRERGRSGHGSRDGRDGEPGRAGRGRESARNDGTRGTETQRGRNSRNGQSLDRELDDALKDFRSVLDEFKRAGKADMSLSLVGMNARQLEMLPRLIEAGAKVGYVLLRKGLRTFAEWASQMRKHIGESLHDAGLADNEVDAFIREMWKSKLPMNGETRTLEEWAAILGKEELRGKISATIEEKRKAQQAAESVEVVPADRENIAETLPFLLPQQQDDVLKAETQFFDESHNDRDHAFGKGYMFTNGTGTGKTYTGLGIVKRFIRQGKGRVLILTPSQTKVGDWIKDAANLGIELNDLDAVAKALRNGATATTVKGEGAVITTYANFRQNKALLEDEFDLVVYDESHRLLENKGGIGTAGAMQHYKVSNRNPDYAYLRLQGNDPTWNAMNESMSRFNEKRDALIERLKKETGIGNELTLGQRVELPPVFNGGWTEEKKVRFPELSRLRDEVNELRAKYETEIKPMLEERAKESARRTKVVFLSATPFNTRENLDYAEGYIFSYPAENHGAQSPRSQFYLEHFGAGYRWRYHRLESSSVNPEAVSRQEVQFSDYLQNELQTMSGRIIDSPYDYSRDFPTVTLEKAEEFNNAMEELARDEATMHAYAAVMGDYNYTSALFESMKVSQIIPRMKRHIEKGRKIVVFHRRVESKNPIRPPFSLIFDQARKDLEAEYDADKREKKKRRIAALRKKYSAMLEWEAGLDLRMPREQLADAFGKDEVLFFSGKESKKAKDKAVADFNDDSSGKNIIVIQEASGKEGISLHDTTGKHQRVLVTLALPQSPITALQIEGRIYRIGNKSNAIFEYPLLGLNAELMLFGQKFNQQVSTTENLALGSKARNLRESFSRGVEEHSGDVDLDGQGVGGKEFDSPALTGNDPFDNAVLDYYTNQRLTGRRDNREGKDYYPTPEPLGYMMAQWGRIGEGESVLEPSAGHGAVARYVPRENPLTAIEPSQSLFGKLQLKAGGNGRKFENTVFEDYNVANKHDVVLMNPPFGSGGRLAVDHVAKAFRHLDEGGRIVAIIPRGAADKKFDQWHAGQKDAVLTGEIDLPDITFAQAGTSVRCRVVVIDKVTDRELASRASAAARHIDLSTREYGKMEDFFDDLRDISMPERTIDKKAKLKKKATATARELRAMKGIKDVELTADRLRVSGRGMWETVEWSGKDGVALTDYLAERFERFNRNQSYYAAREDAEREAVYEELKKLTCKLVGMTEDEMRRYLDSKPEDDVLYRKTDEDLGEVNERFNEQLDGLTEENASSTRLQLGRPSSILLSVGIPDKPFILYGNKLMKKAKQHDFSPKEVKDLPLAMQSPIAAFVGSHPNSFAILSEMEIDGKNVLVSIETEKNGEIDFNIISSVFGKNSKGVIKWILDGKLLYADKEKALSYISASAPIADATYKEEPDSESLENLHLFAPIAEALDSQELSSAANIVRNFENPNIGDENLRGGNGALTDDELSYENDPVAKMTGRSTRTAAQRRAFAIRERQRMVTAVQELAEKLHLDNVDIVTDASTLQEERAKAKGFYSRSTGRITIVISNHRSVFDAEQTLLHEAVAHYGLRQLFGSHFNTFLDNVFRNADEAIRQKIVDLSKKHNWNIHTATEEYLASLAENTDFENINASWWQEIKELFLNMLHKIGFEDFSGVTLSDNELRYILWRSYENLAEPGRYRSILGTAADTRKQYELGVGNFASSVEADTRVAESTDRDDDVRFRFSDRPAIIQEYDKAVSTNEFRFQEAFQDSMLSLKLLQNVIEKYSKKRIRSFENAYTAENRLSSLNKIDNERYIKNYFEPLLDVVKKLSDKYGRQKVEDYIYAKSGLERNDVLLHRDAKAAYDEGKAELDDKLDKGKINQDQYDVLMQQVQADYEKKLAEGGDYSGLEGLVLRDQQDQLDEDLKNQVIDKLEYNRRIKEIKAQYKTHAEELVRDFESEATQEEIDSLWQHINNATNATLDKLLESGMLSQERYEEIKNMMQYYVPLKGWQEDIAEDVYDYTRRETPVQKEKKAKGRKSLADNPIAQIALSAQNAIILGNRNKMKQRFYNFVINRPNELAVIANVWYAHTYNTVHGQVEKVYPDINENDSPETIMQKMDDFEKRMQKEKEEGRAYRGKVPFGMELKTKSGQRPEHFVSLMINGIEYVIYINGDPRAAQALNGKTNPEGEENIFWEYYNRLKRLYGGGLTSNNPDFVAANFVRDTIQSATMEYMNKGFLASAHYLRNIPKSFAAVLRGVFEHYNPNRQTDVYFKEFIENGGETGYTAVHTIEDYKKEYERALQEIRGIRKTFSMTRDGLNAVIKCLETANRIAEDVNRFNAYMSSRQAGYGIEDSIDAAKNISVNFNKKGALGKGKGAWAALAWFMNKWILFFNPAVQGLYQVGQAAKNHKKRVLKTLGTIMASGFVMPMLNELLISALGGGDDDDYFNQTDYTRMNNWLIYGGGGYIKIPLPPLFREVYGLGDILYRVLTNRMTPEKAAVSTARQVQSAVGFINLIPEGEPSVQEAVGGLMPDLVAPFMDVAFNRDFMGHDIAKVTDYTKNLPEYERVYKGVSPVYVEISRILNNVGGNDALRSHFWGTFINPAYMEHIITSYTGGIGKTMSNLTGMVVDVTTGDWGDIEPRTIPIVNRFINPVTEKTVTAAVNRVFYEYRDRYEELRVAEKRYKQFINDGRTEFKDEFEQMQESGEIEFINYFKQKMKTLRKMEDRLKDNPGDKELEMRIREFKAGMIMKAKEILK